MGMPDTGLPPRAFSGKVSFAGNGPPAAAGPNACSRTAVSGEGRMKERGSGRGKAGKGKGGNRGAVLAPGCTGCGLLNCYRQDRSFPAFCPTLVSDAADRRDAVSRYVDDPEDSAIARAAAEIEGLHYGKLTRVEEVVAFAKRLGVKKVGIATCIGLMDEARTFMRVLEAKGLEGRGVICKVGSVDKTAIGIPEDLKILKGRHESICNPILQARLLNAEKCGLNVIVGLCVGHDSLFVKYSEAPVTTLITKDRVLAHNPAAALYACGFYYKRILEPEG